jgi:hypothetical protein
VSCIGGAQGLEKSIFLDPATAVLMRAELKSAAAKCPTRALPGAMVQLETCVWGEQRNVIARYRPGILDLFEILFSQIFDSARKFDSRIYNASEFAAAITNSKAQFAASIKQRLVEEFRSSLKSAAATCPPRAQPGHMTQTQTCVLSSQRKVWARYASATLDLFDSFSTQKLQLANQFDGGNYPAPDYEAASRQLLSALIVSLRERAASSNQTASPNAPTTTGAIESSTSQNIQVSSSDACTLASSLVGVVVGVATRRGDTGLNAANSYLRGCLGDSQR